MSRPRKARWQSGHCHKKAYPNFAHAKRDATHVGRKGESERYAEAFKCKDCGQWHVGTKERRLRYRPKHNARHDRVSFDD